MLLTILGLIIFVSCIALVVCGYQLLKIYVDSRLLKKYYASLQFYGCKKYSGSSGRYPNVSVYMKHCETGEIVHFYGFSVFWDVIDSEGNHLSVGSLDMRLRMYDIKKKIDFNTGNRIGSYDENLELKK
jgi:hypothetical protein